VFDQGGIDLVVMTGLSSDMGKYGFWLCCFLERKYRKRRIGLLSAWASLASPAPVHGPSVSRTLHYLEHSPLFLLAYRHQSLYFTLN
jgi:hypothetical protein